jgi:hypothetical protein
MATDTSDQEQQQRELQEIRRKFHEVGARLGSAFEPAPPDAEDEDVRSTRPALPALELAEPWSRPPSWLVAAGVGLLFVLGIGLGYLLPRSGAGAQPASVPRPSAATPAAPPPTTAPPAVVPRSCLQTARLGDEVIHLLVTNVRTRRLAVALKAYTLASQACRKEASP